MSLKQKTVDGLMWSFIDTAIGQGIQFIVSIVLARLLIPREFGLIGMILIFIALSEAFVNSGFSSALIRKKNCSQTDYSTVFVFNLVAGVVFFIALFFAAPFISNFFNEPQLKPIVQVLGLVLIVDSLTLIQRTILTRQIDFKLQARVSFIASAGSGIVAIYMAWQGMGVWSLVAQRISRQTINTVFLLFWTKWKPSLHFSFKSFKELFGFGSKLLISNLIDTFYNNVYYLLIGKYFSAQQLGFYTRADEFNRLPSYNLSAIIQRVSYPVLCSIQDDPVKLVHSYRRFIRSSMFISFNIMMLMAAMAEPLIITLIGEKWRESVSYFQLLCFTGMFYPLHVLNLNIIQVKGRSDLFLKLEIIKKILAVPTIILGVAFGIKAMIAGMMVNTLIDFYLNNSNSRQMIGYSFKQQIRDILPSFSMALIIALAVYSIGAVLSTGYGATLAIQSIFGLALIVVISEFTRLSDYIFLKETVREKMMPSAKRVVVEQAEV
jgi:O-antigen/teichoic acid export membrane protein